MRIEYRPAEHDVTLTADHPGLYAPDHVNPNYATDTAVGDFDAAFAAAAVRIDEIYETPAEHNNPMEPHATIAEWDGDRLTLYDSNQGPPRVKALSPMLFDLDPVPGPRRLGARGRRVRRQGHASAQRRPGRHGGESGRPAGQVRPDPPAHVRRRRLPHAVDPAGSAGRRPGRTPDRHRP